MVRGIGRIVKKRSRSILTHTPTLPRGSLDEPNQIPDRSAAVCAVAAAVVSTNFTGQSPCLVF